ncbi:MAG: glycerophosphoryl diester phosphodiesterase [Candidatus Endonucleobacter sp. (ex Gigantidas childressi)]|nr:glycerophosphoryl diester phosphodiesterase [Candidatus Endonucleobacter sp. (ex Gigantidas childressi)]
MNGKMSPIIGHRGVAGLAPENTIAGIRKAVEMGLKWIELDVTLLGDGTPVMFHDAKLKRTTNGHGYINSITAHEANRLDAGSWFSDIYAGEKIPSFASSLEHVKTTGLGLNLEIKPNRCDQALLVKKVNDVLQQTEFPVSQLIVSSFNIDTLILLGGYSSQRCACLFERLPRNWRVTAEHVNAVNIHLNGNNLSEKTVHMVKEAGYGVYCYTVNKLGQAKVLFNWGVDGVFSDYPDHLISDETSGLGSQ